MAAHSSGRWRNQAKLEAALRFGPQRTALHEAAEEAQNNYRQTVRSGNSAAQLTKLAATSAAPGIEHAYAGADAATGAGATLVSKALAGLGGVADQFKGDQASEVQTQLANLASARARDLAMLTQQGVAAQAGAQFNQQNASSTLAQALGQLVRKGQSLSSEEGLFTTATASKLRNEAEEAARKERENIEDNSTSRTNSQESNRTSRENAKEKAAAAAAGSVGGVKQRTPHEQEGGLKELTAMQGLASAAFHEGHNRAQVRSILTEDEPSVSKSVSQRGKDGKPTGVSHSVSIPGRKAYSPSPLMEAALDVAQFGGVTSHTIQRLHDTGYSIRQLGLHPVSHTQTKVLSGVGAAARKAAGSIRF